MTRPGARSRALDTGPRPQQQRGVADDATASLMASVQRLALALDAYRWDAARLGVWADALRDLDPRAVDRAVDQLVATADRMPTPAAVRRLVLREVRGDVLTAFEAWEGVLDAVRRHGRTAAPDLPELTMRALAAVGGFVAVCNSELPDAIRAHFLRAYEALAERAEREALVAPGLLPVLDALASRWALTDGSAREAPSDD